MHSELQRAKDSEMYHTTVSKETTRELGFAEEKTVNIVIVTDHRCSNCATV